MRPDELERIEAAMRERVAALPPRPADGWSRVERRIRRYRVQRAATAAGAALAAVLALAVLFTMPPEPGPVVVRPGPVTTVPGPAPTTTSTTTPPARKDAAVGVRERPEAGPGTTSAGGPAAAGGGQRPGAAGSGGGTKSPAPADPSDTTVVPVVKASLSFASAEGDSIGEGRSGTLRPPAVTFTLLENPPHSESTIRVKIDSDETFWSLSFAAPRGETLHTGTYLNAERAPFRSDGAPGLDIYADYNGCNLVWGQFTVHEIIRDGEGKLRGFDASFVQHCDSETRPPLEGRVRVMP